MRIEPYTPELFISGVFVFITGAMALMMVCIGLMARRAASHPAACSRAYWAGGTPTCRVNATLNVLAEL